MANIYIFAAVKRLLLTGFIMCVLLSAAVAQKDLKVIQFSGYALTSDSLMGIPYTHITIVNRGRVAQSGPDGFFSFTAVLGDTLYFTCVGFQPVMYVVPKTMDGDKFSVIQLMTKSDIYLPSTIIYPWGDKSNFHQAFLDTHPPEDDLDRAKRNLERERLAALGQKLESDATEAGERSLANRSTTNYYYGQVAPQNIFNPLAWAEFIKAWQNGQFKKDQQNSKNKQDNNSNQQDLYAPLPPNH
jgi:hypothetical protein